MPALFFITSWDAENKHMSVHFDFNRWTGSLKPFYAELADMLERVDVRQHLITAILADIECTRAEARGSDAFVAQRRERGCRRRCRKAREIAREIAASAAFSTATAT